MTEPTPDPDWEADHEHGTFADYATPDDEVKTIPAEEYTEDGD